MLPKLNSAHGSETRNIINRAIDVLNQHGTTIQNLAANGQLTEDQYAQLLIIINGMIKSGDVTMADLSHDLQKDIKDMRDKNKATNLRIDNIIVESGGDSNIEVADARYSLHKDKTFESLSARINENESEFGDFKQFNAVTVKNEISGKGVNRSDWNFNYGHLRISEDGYFIVDSSSHITVYHDLNAAPDDLLYISLNYYADASNPGSAIKFELRNDSTLIGSNPFRLFGDVTESTHKSGIIKPEERANRIYIAREGVGGEYYFNNVVVINLTESFGKGSEPTKDEMDRYLSRFTERYFDDEQFFDILNHILHKNKNTIRNLYDDISGTVQKMIYDNDGTLQRIEHRNQNDDIVRSDHFTFEEEKITEKRTLAGTSEDLTYVYNLNDNTVEVI